MSGFADAFGASLGNALASSITGDAEYLSMRRYVSLAQELKGPQVVVDPEVAKAKAFAEIEVSLEPSRAACQIRIDKAQAAYDQARADGRDTTYYEATLKAQHTKMQQLLA